MARETDVLTSARTAALFTSDLSAHCHHTHTEVAAAISRAIRAHHGARGCAGEVAAAYGEHPETAALRMRWARSVIQGLYSPSVDGSAPETHAHLWAPGMYLSASA